MGNTASADSGDSSSSPSPSHDTGSVQAPPPPPPPAAAAAAAADETSSTEEEEEEDDGECPCIKDIKEGPCGEPFMAAFDCYRNSQEEEKGADCREFFVALQECMKEHPEAFEKMEEAEEYEQNKRAQEEEKQQAE